jgi:hypothetical protein
MGEKVAGLNTVDRILIWSELSIPLFYSGVGVDLGVDGCFPFEGRAGSDRDSFCDG